MNWKPEPTRIVEVLTLTLDLIRDREHWTPSFTAVDADGGPVNPTSNRAEAWAIEGALLCVLGLDEAEADRTEWACWEELLHDCLRGTVPESVHEVGGHTAVVGLLEKTIRRLGGRI